MAKLFPSWEIILNSKVLPTEGERRLLKFLDDNLNNNYEIYWQPFINGDQPDIIILRENSGALVIEVKDWNLENYYLDEKNNWRLCNNNSLIKSPIRQVQFYWSNLIKLHIASLYEKSFKNNKYFAVVKTALFFSMHTREFVLDFLSHNNRNANNVIIIGNDDLNNNDLDEIIRMSYLNRESELFDDIIYKSFKRYLQPPIHQIEDGISITYSKKQKLLIESTIGQKQKIKGVAGSGKTFVLSKRAVNAHIRTGSKVLILTYNISLKNYIHDKINDVREKFDWENFYITHYHKFILDQANHHNLMFKGFESWEDTNFFDPVQFKTQRFDTVLIDEAQDYKSEWLEIMTKYFMHENTEYVVFADEKQNIYDRSLDDEKKPVIKGITGTWNQSLRKNRRFTGDIAELVMDFQKKFLINKYEIDNIETDTQQIEIQYTNPIIRYYLLDGGGDLTIFNIIKEISNELRLHPSDICILNSKVDILREVDFLIRNENKEKTTTMFETKEIYDHLYKKMEAKINQEINKKKQRLSIEGTEITKDDLNEINEKNEKLFNLDLEKIRKYKKYHFWMKTGTMKLSTIHSFKGWEIPSLFLIINVEDGNDFTNAELIYTALTRAQFNLIILNVNENIYHDYFSNYID